MPFYFYGHKNIETMTTVRIGLLCSAILMLLCSCGGQHVPTTPPASDTLTANVDTEFSRPINIDTANRMIQSYLTAINSTVNTEEIRSLEFDADVLRAYLAQHLASKNKRIEKIKFIFAHSLDYVNSGNAGKRPDTNSHALTFVIVGVDSAGNYVYTKNGAALDFAQPCPPRCPVQGTSSSNLLVH